MGDTAKAGSGSDRESCRACSTEGVKHPEVWQDFNRNLSFKRNISTPPALTGHLSRSLPLPALAENMPPACFLNASRLTPGRLLAAVWRLSQIKSKTGQTTGQTDLHGRTAISARAGFGMRVLFTKSPKRVGGSCCAARLRATPNWCPPLPLRPLNRVLVP